MRFIKQISNRLVLRIKLLYYTFLDYFESEEILDLSVPTMRVRHTENTKLARGVKALVKRLRSMTPSERVNTENLLGSHPYKKTAFERLQELRVIDKLNKTPIVTTEDDLVNLVVKKAPIYVKEQELRELRRLQTSILRRAAKDPTNHSIVSELKLCRVEMELIKTEIIRMKANV